MNSFAFNGTKQQEPVKLQDIYAPAWIENCLTESEINEIISIGENGSLHPAHVGAGSQGNLDANTRRTLVSWINSENAPKWFGGWLENIFQQVNQSQYRFELNGTEAAQYTKYDAEFLGEYKFHADIMPLGQNCRKLSCSILLSDPQEYEGGNLIIAPHGLPTTLKEKKGKAIFFPSWVPHCVTPVYSGIRRSLVIWANGPMFK